MIRENPSSVKLKRSQYVCLESAHWHTTVYGKLFNALVKNAY